MSTDTDSTSIMAGGQSHPHLRSCVPLPTLCLRPALFYLPHLPRNGTSFAPISFMAVQLHLEPLGHHRQLRISLQVSSLCTCAFDPRALNIVLICLLKLSCLQNLINPPCRRYQNPKRRFFNKVRRSLTLSSRIRQCSDA